MNCPFKSVVGVLVFAILPNKHTVNVCVSKDIMDFVLFSIGGLPYDHQLKVLVYLLFHS